MKKISIYIPVYNQQELVLRALESIPKRDDIQILMCDDGSTDGSYEVMDRFEHPGEIVLMKNKENMGAAYTINRLLDKCEGEYVFSLDNDDYLYTDEFERAMDELDGTDLVYIDMVVNNGDTWKMTPDTKNLYCAGFTKFVRREFLGNTRHPLGIWCSDWHYFQDLQAKHPTEKFTGIAAYHYNHPREGSMIWLASKGMIPEGYKVV